MKTINICVPLNVACLTAVIETLETELEHLDVETVSAPAPSAPAPAPASNETEQDNTNVVQLNTASAPAPAAANVVVVEPGEKGTGAAGIVEVDADGLPWDARIHAASRATLKRGGTWKLARGVDPALVETVKAELQTAMAATGAPAATETEATTTAPAAKTAPPPPAAKTAPPPPAASAPAPEPLYILEGSGEFTREQLVAVGWDDENIDALPVKQVTTADVLTFPDLMAQITAAGIDEATVLTAVNNQGIQALPLLAARPDLIPAVYDELFK